MKSVLLIDCSPLFSGFLHDKFSMEQIALDSVSNREAYTKMVTLLPDLIIIEVENGISEDIMHFLEKKSIDPNARRIPIIITGPVIDRSKIANLVEFNVVKYFSKPVKFDVFFDSIGKILKIEFSMDTTPCILDIHLNGNLIFIEVALGLNREKLMLLKYRIAELVEKYRINVPKVMLMLTNMQLSFIDGMNLEFLIDNISSQGKIPNKHIKILTSDSFTRELVKGHPEYSGIQVSDDIEFIVELISDQDSVSNIRNFLLEKVLTSDRPASETVIGFIDSRSNLEGNFGNMMRVAVIDDDVVVRKLLQNTFSSVSGETDLFETAGAFFNSLSSGKDYDIVIMDLFLPDMDGISVLKNFQRKGLQMPVIVYSRAAAKDVVMQALALGTRSYLVKPQKPSVILGKVLEILHSSF
ncbi:response regulator [Treponema sp.]|uniref:response regulator n=1 Tax=Treponema sp. TaxID=166 RepID=UPI003F0EB587